MAIISFRRLEPHDRAAYRAIRLAALKGEPENYGSTYEEESVITVLPFEHHVIEQSPLHVVYGAFSDGELIGITAYFREVRRKLSHRGKVTQVYVAPEHRGKGLAKQLVKAVVDDAFRQDGLEILTLEVVATNVAAIRTYEALEFVEYGLMERYFKTDGGYTDQRYMVLSKEQAKEEKKL